MISERLKELIDRLELKSAYAFEKSIGAGKNAINAAIKNNGTIGSDIVGKIFTKYPNLNLEWLLAGEGPMFKTINISALKSDNVQAISTALSTGNSKKKDLPVHRDTRIVPILSTKVAASAFQSGYLSEDYIDNSETVEIPRTLLPKPGQYCVLDVTGESMTPTLYRGDKVIGRLIEPSEWTREIRDNNIYIVSTKTDGGVIKRLKNRLLSQKFIRCRSDAPGHPSFNINAEDINVIFEVVCKLSWVFPHENLDVYHKVLNLMDDVEMIKEKLNLL